MHRVAESGGMSSLPVLLRRYKEVYRQYVELEHQLADLDRQILATERSSSKPRRKNAPQLGVSDAILSVLRVLRESREPLPPREVASRLNIKSMLASQRLSRAAKLGYVERTGNARYRVVDAVPAL